MPPPLRVAALALSVVLTGGCAEPRPGRSTLRLECQRLDRHEREVDAHAAVALDLAPGHVAVVAIPASRPRDVFFLVFVGVQ